MNSEGISHGLNFYSLEFGRSLYGDAEPTRALKLNCLTLNVVVRVLKGYKWEIITSMATSPPKQNNERY